MAPVGGLALRGSAPPSGRCNESLKSCSGPGPWSTHVHIKWERTSARRKTARLQAARLQLPNFAPAACMGPTSGPALASASSSR